MTPLLAKLNALATQITLIKANVAVAENLARPEVAGDGKGGDGYWVIHKPSGECIDGPFADADEVKRALEAVLSPEELVLFDVTQKAETPSTEKASVRDKLTQLVASVDAK